MKDNSLFKVRWSGRGHAFTDDEADAVINAMRSADPGTQGVYLKDFERRFCEITGAPNGFAVTSGTAALEIAALLCRVGHGDEVILPAHTFAATAIPFARTGATLRWADIDPDTRLVTADTIRPLMNSKTRVIVPVHLYGLVCDMDPILDLACENDVIVVEDAAQCLGVSYKGRAAGTLGDFGCYSLHSHKNISTLGEGGILTVRDPATAKLVPGLRHNGMRRYEGEREAYWIPAMTNVDFDLDGLWPYNFCIGEVQCAVGIKLLDRLHSMIEDRRRRTERFSKSLSAYPEILLQTQPRECGHAHHLLAFRYNGPASRDRFLSALAFEHGVQAVVQYCPLYRYPMFEKAGFGDADCPATDEFFDNMVSVPFHHWMSEDEFDLVIAGVIAATEQMRREGAMTEQVRL